MALKLKKRWLLDFAIFAGIFYFVNNWQSKDLIASNEIAPSLPGDENIVPSSSSQKTLVYFFAPWCSVCKISAPNLSTLQTWMGADRIRIIPVALDYESKTDVESFAKEYALPSPPIFGDEKTAEAWRIRAYPTLYILDGQGQIKAAATGYTSVLGLLWRAF